MRDLIARGLILMAAAVCLTACDPEPEPVQVPIENTTPPQAEPTGDPAVCNGEKPIPKAGGGFVCP